MARHLLAAKPVSCTKASKLSSSLGSSRAPIFRGLWTLSGFVRTEHCVAVLLLLVQQALMVRPMSEQLKGQVQ